MATLNCCQKEFQGIGTSIFDGLMTLLIHVLVIGLPDHSVIALFACFGQRKTDQEPRARQVLSGPPAPLNEYPEVTDLFL